MEVDLERYLQLSLKARVSEIANVAAHFEKDLNEAIRGFEFYFKVDIDFIRQELALIEDEFEKLCRIDDGFAGREEN